MLLAKYQDYITIDEEVQKININRYIGRIKKEKEDEIDNIKIKVNFVDIYKDYEIPAKGTYYQMSNCIKDILGDNNG